MNRPYQNYERPYTNNERPYSHNERPYSHNERPYLQSERPYSNSERPYSNYERPYSNYERPKGRYQPYETDNVYQGNNPRRGGGYDSGSRRGRPRPPRDYARRFSGRPSFHDQQPVHGRSDRGRDYSYGRGSQRPYRRETSYNSRPERNGRYSESHFPPSEPFQPKERLCRTLFVRNIEYGTTEEELYDYFSAFGAVKNLFNLIENRGMVFVTFYDIRAAESCKIESKNKKFNGRPADVHYSFPKEEIDTTINPDREKNQGTLFVTLREGGSPPTNDDFGDFFSSFGEVKLVRDFKTNVYQKFIEFYDSRDCLNALDNALGQSFMGGTFDCKLAWDKYSLSFSSNTRNAPSRRGGSSQMRGRRGGLDSHNRRSYDHVESSRPRYHSDYDNSSYTPSRSEIAEDSNESVEKRLEQAQQAQRLLSMMASQFPMMPSADNNQSNQGSISSFSDSQSTPFSADQDYKRQDIPPSSYSMNYTASKGSLVDNKEHSESDKIEPEKLEGNQINKLLQLLSHVKQQSNPVPSEEGS